MNSYQEALLSYVRHHWWLIVWALIILIVLVVLARAEFLPAGQARRVWLEMINGAEVEMPAPRYVVPLG